MASKYLRIQTLSGTTPTWNVAKFKFAEIDPTADVAISITGDIIPDGCVLHFKQDSTPRTLTIEGESVSVNPDADSITVIELSFSNLGIGISSSYVAASGPDVTAPTVVSATAINSTTIRVVFSEVVVATNVGWSFKKNGSAHNPSAVSGSGTNTLDFTVGTMLNSDTILRSYDDATGDTMDSATNELASFTDQSVTNSIPSSYDFEAQFNGSNGTALSAYTPEAGTISNITGSPTLNGSGRLTVPASSSFETTSITSAGITTACNVFALDSGANFFFLLLTAGSDNAYLQVEASGSTANITCWKNDTSVHVENSVDISSGVLLEMVRTSDSLAFKINGSTVHTADITGMTFTKMKVNNVAGAAISLTTLTADH